MTDPVGTRLQELSDAVIGSTVREFVADVRQEVVEESSLVLVPDAYYPHHESTGLVTHPAALEALCMELTSLVDDLFVLPAIGRDADAETTLELLGYDRIETIRDVRLRLPEDCERCCLSVRVLDSESEPQRLTVSAPRPLIDHAVVTVPTLRTTGTIVAPGLRTLAMQLTDLEHPSAPYDWTHAVAADAIAEPVLSLLDGTYVFAGRPHRGRFLVAGADATTVDEVAATILDLSAEEVPSLEALGWNGEYRYVDGLSPDALARSLPDEAPAEPSDRPLQKRGYQLYARLTGDGVPPQLLEEDSP
jgi:uncharacterized protein (DUF362 family)